MNTEQLLKEFLLLSNEDKIEFLNSAATSVFMTVISDEEYDMLRETLINHPG